MIEEIKQYFKPNMSNEQKINRVREYLQLLILKILYDRGYFNNLAFEGGTALRILYDLKRFSEALDFSLFKETDWNFSKLISEVKREIELRNLSLDIKSKTEKPVQNAFFKFKDLLYQLEISNFPEQKIAIKVEIDNNPPAGGEIETSFVTKIYMLNLTHPDLSSMFAKKLHACLFRKYTKGRDFYDLVWYLGRNIQPNFELLNNAINQTEDKELDLNENNLYDFITPKLDKINFRNIREDVERFLEDKNELRLLDEELIKNSLKTNYKKDR